MQDTNSPHGIVTTGKVVSDFRKLTQGANGDEHSWPLLDRLTGRKAHDGRKLFLDNRRILW